MTDTWFGVLRGAGIDVDHVKIEAFFPLKQNLDRYEKYCIEVLEKFQADAFFLQLAIVRVLLSKMNNEEKDVFILLCLFAVFLEDDGGSMFSALAFKIREYLNNIGISGYEQYLRNNLEKREVEGFILDQERILTDLPILKKHRRSYCARYGFFTD